MKKIFLLSCVIILVSCAPKPRPTIEEGIVGKILWVSGNQMPSPNSSPPAPKPVQREVFIYQLTTLNDVTGQAPMYNSIHTKLVKNVLTDENGHFTVYLPVGDYSIFTKEEGGYFAARFDNNSISPISVQQGSMTSITIEINYAAAY